ncbi:hypothetical protein [Pantoea dispersa]|uniref:hypothetical protein n=1 Tax=Pantoea dispersa TaxID=59814 RepID=UPI0021C9DBA1|nr:hypothetical protein [Pantoea dispersa]UXO67329.1 hypothetical protein N7977_12680 [Pantoea dispersa]
MKINISEVHKFFSSDFDKQEQDKEVWVGGKLNYTIHMGVENDDADQVSPFEGQSAIQTLYMANKGTIQHNHEDGSFYFRDNADRMAAYVGGELQQDDQGHFDEFVEFAKGVLANEQDVITGECNMFEIQDPRTEESYEVDANEFVEASGDYVFETPEGLQFTATLEVNDEGKVLSVSGYSEVVDPASDVVYL